MFTTNPELENVSYEEAVNKGPKFLERWRTFQRDRDNEHAAMAGVYYKRKPCEIYTPAKNNALYKKIGHNRIYLDYAPQSTTVYDRTIASCYTPFGISAIDGWFAKQIQSGAIPFRVLKKAILTNPHLHPVIRNNLYHNLLNYNK